jgi:acetyl-CoA carboxylase/biotin carboxylase 1
MITHFFPFQHHQHSLAALPFQRPWSAHRLHASEGGIVNFVKQPGVSLEPGDILGILTFDDLTPGRVKHAEPFYGLFPSFGPPGVSGNKSDQLLARYVDVSSNILEGFDNQLVMEPSLIGLTDVLKDSDLGASCCTAGKS